MKFTVVIATIREDLPGFQETMGRIQATFDYPTEFHLLDGHQGKAQALNKAADDILAVTDADCYVTMDDDIVPDANWQRVVSQAFIDLPQFGAFGLWMGDEADKLEYMGAHLLDIESTVGQTRYRRLRPPHHLFGGFIAYRPDVARQVGKIPLGNVKYQLWEDAWRGRRVTKLGWEMAFLMGVQVDMVEYEDPQAYLDMKQRDIESGRKRSDRVLAESGLGDPALLRIRKWVAKMRGRA